MLAVEVLLERASHPLAQQVRRHVRLPRVMRQRGHRQVGERRRPETGTSPHQQAQQHDVHRMVLCALRQVARQGLQQQRLALHHLQRSLVRHRVQALAGRAGRSCELLQRFAQLACGARPALAHARGALKLLAQAAALVLAQPLEFFLHRVAGGGVVRAGVGRHSRRRLHPAALRVVVQQAVRPRATDQRDVARRLDHAAAGQERMFGPRQVDPDVQPHHELADIDRDRWFGMRAHAARTCKA